MKFWKIEILEKCSGPVFHKPTKNVFEKIQIWEQLLKSKSPLSAIHKIIWHIWEPRSRKVNNDEPDLRFFHGNFWPVISHAVRKPCFSTSIPRGQNLPSRARNTKWHFWASPIWQAPKGKPKEDKAKGILSGTYEPPKSLHLADSGGPRIYRFTPCRPSIFRLSVCLLMFFFEPPFPLK